MRQYGADISNTALVKEKNGVEMLHGLGGRIFDGGCPLLVVPKGIFSKFLEVVDQAIEFPLEVHLVFAAQGEPIEAFVGGEIGEDGFDDAESAGVCCSS